jgi:acetolactate synthase-1/2/3 large subunit
MQYESRIIGGDLVNPDFVKMAESFGAAAYRVDSPQSLQSVLEKAIAEDKPCLIDVQVERGSEVSPWEFIMMNKAPE